MNSITYVVHVNIILWLISHNSISTFCCAHGVAYVDKPTHRVG
jgi:hypothetical protein